ncbi:parkinson disease 7 protein [Capsaspora owczarzaki ATCC 30864]|uniref:Parkinson disease 7 protein n=1 Tax=Capsaspora owczarzaki (strain ATCC 30864) TaxID=595528 RepID=A0A0D2WQ63_CAPO3|nr:parkinson disease 7 protein [Capsaspora owczarzaki ATCC 30864]
MAAAAAARHAKRALVALAPGAEEMEAVITIDVLRRAGIETVVASTTTDLLVPCSRQVVIKADATLEDSTRKEQHYDVVVIPGGLNGAKALADSRAFGEVLKEQERSNRTIAAICAGPIALLSHQIGVGKEITSHPSVRDKLHETYKYSEHRVVTDGQLITRQHLLGDEERNKVTAPMVLHPSL